MFSRIKEWFDAFFVIISRRIIKVRVKQNTLFSDPVFWTEISIEHGLVH